MLQALHTARLPYKKVECDPLCIDPTNYFDPEDQLADIMQGMVQNDTTTTAAGYGAETEAMDLSDMIVKSILSCPKEMQCKLSSNMILCGGTSLTPNIITQIEDLVF